MPYFLFLSPRSMATVQRGNISGIATIRRRNKIALTINNVVGHSSLSFSVRVSYEVNKELLPTRRFWHPNVFYKYFV